MKTVSTSRYGVSRVSTKEPLAHRLGEWFWSNAEEMLTLAEIALRIKKLRREMQLPSAGNSVREKDVSGAMTEVRKYLELKHKVTLHRVPKFGYRIANGKETVTYGMKTLKMTAMWAERGGRIADIINERKLHRFIPEAVEEVFGVADDARKLYCRKAKRFVLAWSQEQAAKRKEITDGKEAEKSKKV